MQRFAFVVLALVLGVAPPARAASSGAEPRAIKVAVLDIRANGVEDGAARTLSEILAVEVGKLPRTTVITDAEVANLIGLEQRKQIVGCDDNVSCAADIAGALGVDKLCTGSMGKVDSTTVLTLRVLDVASAKVDIRLYETETGGAAAFIRKMPQLVARLFPDRSHRAALDAAPKPGGAGPAPGSAGFDETARRTLAQAAQSLQGVRPPVRGSNLLLNQWAWAGAAGLALLGGVGLAGSSSDESTLNSAGTMILLGAAVGLGSAVLCFVPGLGSGSDAPTLEHPFQAIDGAPDRRSPFAPHGASR